MHAKSILVLYIDLYMDFVFYIALHIRLCVLYRLVLYICILNEKIIYHTYLFMNNLHGFIYHAKSYVSVLSIAYK